MQPEKAVSPGSMGQQRVLGAKECGLIMGTSTLASAQPLPWHGPPWLTTSTFTSSKWKVSHNGTL